MRIAESAAEGCLVYAREGAGSWPTVEKESLYLTGGEKMQLKGTGMFRKRTLFNLLMFVRSLPAALELSLLLFFDVDLAFVQTICW